MNSHLSRPLARLAGALADLRLRVREALAGELSRAVAETVREIVATAIGGGMIGQPPVDGPFRTDVDRDPWDDDRLGWADDDYEKHEDSRNDYEPSTGSSLVDQPSSGPAALSTGLAAGRWWLGRRGSIPEAVGVGVLVTLAVFAGGPVARAGTAVAATIADLTVVTDALDAVSSHLTPI